MVYNIVKFLLFRQTNVKYYLMLIYTSKEDPAVRHFGGPLHIVNLPHILHSQS